MTPTDKRRLIQGRQLISRLYQGDSWRSAIVLVQR